MWKLVVELVICVSIWQSNPSSIRELKGEGGWVGGREVRREANDDGVCSPVKRLII